MSDRKSPNLKIYMEQLECARQAFEYECYLKEEDEHFHKILMRFE